MRRDQLEHAIRAACQIIGHREVIVVGSQAILGSIPEHWLPLAATMSLEIDILPIATDNDETARLADVIEGVAGEFSPFEELHGFSIDGVDLTTSVLPDGWRERLVWVSNANTAAPSGEPHGREGEGCHRCGAPLVREHFMNRSSFFCPCCQRRPRSCWRSGQRGLTLAKAAPRPCSWSDCGRARSANDMA